MWFSVRHIIHNDSSYEERVTMWQAGDFEAALALARPEAQQYAETVLFNGKLLPCFQVFLLSDDPVTSWVERPTDRVYETFAGAHGAEVFARIRESNLAPSEFLETFYDTGAELESVRLETWRTD